MQQRTIVWGMGALAVIAAVVSGVVLFHGSRSTASVVPVPETSSWAVNDAFAKAVSYAVLPKGRVAAGIVPHHTLVAPLIAAFFRGLEASHLPSTVVIVGPDHENQGIAYVTTSNDSWSTPDGIVTADRRVIQALVERDVASFDDILIRNEPSVSAVLPYLEHRFPDTSVVPLAIRGDLRSDKLDQLAGALADILGPDDLVIASVDFSHYKDTVGAWSDDAVSLPVIRRMDVDAALTIPVDSPPAISLVLRYAKLRGLSYQELVHTNSAEFLHDLTIPSTTSYLAAYFYR